ncbi:MAG: hypothetical protein HZB39_16550 [Planctomycetes bacterium]|nr:hypothetical protein [Planctomycetota bacterium]
MAPRPGFAALVTFVVPGLGHLLIGRPVRGVLAFASTVGLFALGWSLLHDRLWHLSAVPPTGMLRWFPVLLQPEFVNFGCLETAAFLRGADTPEALRHVLLPRPGEHLAMLVSGASGFAAALWAADASWIASGATGGRVAPSVASAMTWLVPGSGHVLAGQRSKGLLLGGVVVLTFALGLVFGGGHSCDRPQMPFWWAGQSIFGGGVAFAALVTAPRSMVEYPPLFDLGVILCTIAGLMNAMVMTDAWSVAQRDGVDGAEPAEAGA